MRRVSSRRSADATISCWRPDGRAELVAKVLERQRQVFDVFAQHGDGGLQVVALGALDPYRVALDAGLYLELAVLDEGDDFLGVFLGDAVADGEDLLDLIATHFLDLAMVQEAHVDVAARHLVEQYVDDLVELEFTVGVCGQDFLGLLDPGVRPFEIKARADLFVGLFNRVAQFDLIGFADGIE